jgi:hypothetical protein
MALSIAAAFPLPVMEVRNVSSIVSALTDVAVAPEMTALGASNIRERVTNLLKVYIIASFG